MNKITKLLLATSIAALPSMAGVFVGIDYNTGDDFSAESTAESGYAFDTNEITLSGYTISLGSGSIDSSIFEVYYSSQSTEGEHVYSIFDRYAEYIYSSDTYSEIGLNYRPYWKVSGDLHWYLDMGLAYGSSDTLSSSYFSLSDDTISCAALKLGAGISYIIADQFELNVGYRYSYNTWSDVEVQFSDGSRDTVSTTSSGGGIYLGMNIWFGNASSDYSSNTNSKRELEKNQDETLYDTPEDNLVESAEEVF